MRVSTSIPTLEKNLIALIGNLVDSISMSVRKWTNQNFCKNYEMRMINSFLLNISEFLDNRSFGSDAIECHVLLAGNI